MAVGFIQLNENDTKELRKEIGLPVTTSEDYSISNVNNKDELVEVGDLDEGWQGKLLSRFGKLEREFGLMEHSFSIMANAGKDGKISSYAICVYEPDLVEDRRDSSKNTVLARVKEDVLKSNADIVEVYSKYFGKNDEKKRYDKDSDEFIDRKSTRLNSSHL